MKHQFITGLLIGLLGAVLLWFLDQPLWRGFVIGSSLTLIGWILIRRKHRNRVLSCFLAATLGASPNMLAEFSAGYSGQSCYCFSPAAEDATTQEAFRLSFILAPDETGIVRPAITGMAHPGHLVDWEEFNASLALWGINLEGGAQYAVNGFPAAAAEVPFVFGDWSAPLAIYPERPQYRVVVEVTGDLAFWQPLARFSAPSGVAIELRDSPEGPQTFYRVSMEEAPGDFQAQGPLILGCGIGVLVGTGVIAVLAVRQCAKNRKKFEQLLPPKETNAVDQAQSP